MSRVGLIIPAAGAGERLGAVVPKSVVPLAGVPLLVHAVRRGLASGAMAALVVTAPEGREAEVEKLLAPEVEAEAATGLEWRVVEGGATRQQSVSKALAALPASVDVVVVHDAARCLAPPGLFADVVAAVVSGHGAVVPAVAVVDTLKQVDDDGVVVATPDRSAMRAVQTPQAFRRSVLEDAHRAAVKRGDSGVTDDAGLVERAGGVVQVVPGHDDAFKITRPVDLLMAEALLAGRGARA